MPMCTIRQITKFNNTGKNYSSRSKKRNVVYSLSKDGVTEMEKRSEPIATRKLQLNFLHKSTFFKIPPPELLPKTTKLCLEVKVIFFLLQLTWLTEMHLQPFQRLAIFIWAFTGKSVSSHCIFWHWTTTEVELVQLRKSNWIILNIAVDYYTNIFKDLQKYNRLRWPERKLHNSTILLILCKILYPWTTSLWMFIL